MKSTYRYIIPVLTTIMVLTSCSDELLSGDNGYSQSEGSRTIAVSFGPQTRTALGDDGLTPEFTGQDEWVKVSNSRKSEDCQITVDDDGNASFKTSLKGTLTAVYPATAAKIEKDVIAGVKVSSEQSGTFANANICMAENITENEARFINQTAILKFYVGEEIGVTSINVTSSGEDIADGSKTITVAASGGKTLYDNMPTGQDKRICYVAVKSGANANTLTFTTKTNTQGQQTKTSTVDATLAIGMMYNAFIPYYVEVGDQKWAYCNIGAFLPEEPGEYFAWGEIKGHKADFSISPDDDGHIPGAFASDFKAFDHSDVRYTGTYNPSSGFQFCNTPYYNGTSFDKYTGSDGNTLLLEDDAANANWGNNWRMPTSQDFQNLYGACSINGYGITTYAGTERGEVPTFSKGVYWCGNYDGVAGCLFCDGTNNLFFPAAGCGTSTKLIDVGKYVRYWSSIKASYDYYAYRLDISDSDVDLQLYGNRFDGNSIRPIYSEKPLLLPGEFSVGATKKVRFARGNLYWDMNKKSYLMEDNQCDYRNYHGKTDDAAIIGEQSTTTPENTVGGFWWVKNTETAFYPYDGTYGTPSPNNTTSDVFFTNATSETPNSTFSVCGIQGMFRTLSKQEWSYLLNLGNKTDGSARHQTNMFARARVKGVNGLLVFPDNYELPDEWDKTGMMGLNNKGNLGTFPSSDIPEAVWNAMESDGVLFLPATGYRDNTNIIAAGDYAPYCASDATGISTSNAWILSFDRGAVYLNSNAVRSLSSSIRLVVDIKP